MASFDITMVYTIINGVVHLKNASLSGMDSQTIPDNNSTSVSANGDINLQKGDTATLSFEFDDDDDWGIYAVMLKDTGKSGFGVQEGGGNVIDDEEEQDFPTVSQTTGTVSPTADSPNTISFEDANVKDKTVDYQVVFQNSSTGEFIVTDPRVRSGGGMG